MEQQSTHERLLSLLHDAGAAYRTIEHAPEGRTDVVSTMRGHDVKHAAKCMLLMVKLGRKMTKYVLAVVPGDRRVDLAAIKAIFNASYVSFASPQIAEQLAGSPTGTVLPFAMHGDVEVVADPALFHSENIYFNAARLDCSISMRSADYRAIAKPRVEPIS